VSPAVASLAAIAGAIVLSCASQLNVGLLAVALAWLIGVFVAGWTAEAVAGGFPTSLFLTLAGVTLLFAASETNGTLDAVARRVMRLARGSAGLAPWLFFLVAMAVSTVGPGAIASTALVAPMAVVLGGRSGVPPFLTALMVANGANAGNLSPLSAVGVIANTKMAGVGLGGHEWKVWAANFAAHLVVAAAALVLFGGLRRLPPAAGDDAQDRPDTPAAPLASRQWLTIGVVGAWVLGVVVFRLNVGFSAFSAAVLLIVLRAADETAAVKRMPWGAILMVCGVSLLVAVLEKSGGMELFGVALARLATPATINGVIAGVTGLISTYSSTSGVVLPTFLPTVPTLVAKVGGGDPLAVALSINVGASIVDVSPLSTLGALCVAAASAPATSRDLFRKMLLWGLSMVVVGALLCQWLAGPFARW